MITIHHGRSMAIFSVGQRVRGKSSPGVPDDLHGLVGTVVTIGHPPNFISKNGGPQGTELLYSVRFDVRDYADMINESWLEPE